MERMISGKDVRDEDSASGKSGFCEYRILVRKGHDDCGDSAFAYSDESKAVVAVFDGVSGEAGAADASSEAAAAILGALKGAGKIGPKEMEAAMRRAQDRITFGLTTAAVASVQKNGAFVVAAVGDSPIYGMDGKGRITLELPLARAVKDGDSVLKYFHYRNLLTSAIGQDSTGELAMRSGRLKNGEALIVASDGLSDNLYVKVTEGFVTDSSGCDDLEEIVHGRKSPASIVDALAAEVAKRLPIGKVERSDSMLVPKEDDLSIAAISMM